VSSSLSHQAAPIEELTSTLEEEHDIKKAVSMQVMAWFGEIDAGLWIMDVSSVVKEIGVGILRAYKDDPINATTILEKWRVAVGDTFADKVAVDLLKGNYLEVEASSFQDHSTDPLLVYFPSSELPTDPAARFSDLFLTRPRWRAEDIHPFLEDIVLDNKDRDKLLLKFARAVTGSGTVWYTSRAKLNP